MTNLTNELTKKQIKEAPDKCPITGMLKCESYTIDGNVVYLSDPPYDAYTLPIYSTFDKCFSHTKYDMDNNDVEEHMHLCDLEDLYNHPNFDEIVRFYNIKL